MRSDDMTAFYQLHRDLPREGPGEAADVAWATALADIAPVARVADVACGPGGDIPALLEAAPQGHVTALDKTAHFVDAARTRWQDDPRVTLLRADMAAIHNEYDLIWCAGAVYFMGVTEALTAWRRALRPGGMIAFSEVCWFTDTPSPRAAKHWQQSPAMTDAEGIAARVAAAGYETIATRRLSDAAWESYTPRSMHALPACARGRMQPLPRCWTRRKRKPPAGVRTGKSSAICSASCGPCPGPGRQAADGVRR
jgi:Methyltransferase domain.